MSAAGGFRPYVFVEDIGESLLRVVENGGEITNVPYAEGALWVATFRDPAGNVVGVWREGPPR